MGELLPVLPPFACQEELTSIMVDSPHEMQDQPPCETRFQLCLICFQSVSEGDDVRKVWAVWANEHIQYSASFMASAVRHGTAKMVMPFVHPA